MKKEPVQVVDLEEFLTEIKGRQIIVESFNYKSVVGYFIDMSKVQFRAFLEWNKFSQFSTDVRDNLVYVGNFK